MDSVACNNGAVGGTGALLISYQTGSLYLIRNFVTGEGTYFEPYEVIDRPGGQVVYGATRRHGILVARGADTFDGKPTVFPVPTITSKEGIAALAMCIAETGGDDGTKRLCGQLLISRLPEGADELTRPYKGAPHQGVDEDPVYASNKQLAEYYRATPFVGAWEHGRPNRDGLVAFGIRMLELWTDVLRLGELPEWFRDDRRAMFTAAQGPSVADVDARGSKPFPVSHPRSNGHSAN